MNSASVEMSWHGWLYCAVYASVRDALRRSHRQTYSPTKSRLRWGPLQSNMPSTSWPPSLPALFLAGAIAAKLAGDGVLIAAVFGLVAVFLKSNRGRNIFTAYPKVLLLPVILGAYLCADYLGTSGFMAAFVVGLIYGNKEGARPCPRSITSRSASSSTTVRCCCA